MSISSKNQICDMALSHMGNYGSVNDIDNPKDSKEITFALWYDVSRQAALRLAIPNFAMSRRRVAEVAVPPEYVGIYGHAYERPADCLKVLGVGDIDNADNVTLEGDLIFCEDYYADGMPLRFILDVEDVSKFTPDFKILLSWILAGNTVLPITQKQALKTAIENALPTKISELAGINAQENKPIRVSTSKFRQSRYTSPSRSGFKR